MPTAAEHLEGLIDFYIRANTTDCFRCQGTKQREQWVDKHVVCPTCKGERKTKYSDPCGLCQGSGEWVEKESHTVTCTECNEAGLLVPTRFDTPIVSSVLLGAVVAMHRAREEADFDHQNQILDWAQRFCMEHGAWCLKQMQDQDTAQVVHDALARGGELKPRDLGMKLAGGALTPEELKALGIEPEQP